MTWKGQITVRIPIVLNYEVTEDWECKDQADAEWMVSQEVSDYLGYVRWSEIAHITVEEQT